MKKGISIIIASILILGMTSLLAARANVKNDEDEIRSLVIQFLEIREEHLLSEAKIDALFEFFDVSVADDLDNNVTLKVFEYERLMRAKNAEFITNDSFKIYVGDPDIEGLTAAVEASEYYEYENIPGVNDISSRSPYYRISLIKNDGVWKIRDIDFKNEITLIVDDVGSIDAVKTLIETN